MGSKRCSSKDLESMLPEEYLEWRMISGQKVVYKIQFYVIKNRREGLARAEGFVAAGIETSAS